MKDVKTAAQDGNVVMRPSADRDSMNLGYFEKDIAKCLLSLKEENFQKSKTYNHNACQTECDVYLISYTGPAGNVDELYVKFSVNRNGWVVLFSFHLQH